VPDALPELNLDAIPDPATRQAVVALLNLVERLLEENRRLLLEGQRLKDEVARLNGEQGRPKVNPQRGQGAAPKPPGDHSSEEERRERKPWLKRAKLPHIEIDRTETLAVDPATLPEDAVFKGYAEVVIQDLLLVRDNVCFRRERFYSPSRHQTYLAPLPPGYEGEFGPGLRTLSLSLCYGALVSKEQVEAFVTAAGIRIASGTVSNFLVHSHERFHAESAAAAAAGLASSPWHHLDETPTRVNGQNYSCRTLCNPLYTHYHTTPTKERLALIETLFAGRPPCFRIDPVALTYLERVGLARKWRDRLGALGASWEEPAAALPGADGWDRSAFEAWLSRHCPTLGPQQRQRVLEAAALAGYQHQREVPVIDTLLCDDAPASREVTANLSLCWIHEGRHYKKLCPWLARYRKALADFRARFWEFYRQLLAYRQQPSPAAAERLRDEFDTLFATRTGYEALDDRIEKTASKKRELLLVLEHPELPLHNNAAELAVRRRVRKRDVSFGPRSAAGARAWDTFQSLAATCAKLGVSFHHYLHDRITRAGRIPRLAALIEERARTLDLGRSWHHSPAAS
jgi:hypothetical protein